MRPPKVLIADSISPRGVDELSRDGALDVSFQTGLTESELVKIIPEFSALVVRSQTKATAPILNAIARSRGIGRAGVLLHPVDVHTATHTRSIPPNAPCPTTV